MTNFLHVSFGNNSIFIKQSSSPVGESKESIEIPLSQIEEEGRDSIKRRIGSLIFERLKNWYPDDFLDPQEPSNQQFGPSSIEGIAHNLIQQSISDKTNVHVASIEYLLKKNPDNKNSIDFLKNSWPPIRDLICSFDRKL